MAKDASRYSATDLAQIFGRSASRSTDEDDVPQVEPSAEAQEEPQPSAKKRSKKHKRDTSDSDADETDEQQQHKKKSKKEKHHKKHRTSSSDGDDDGAAVDDSRDEPAEGRQAQEDLVVLQPQQKLNEFKEIVSSMSVADYFKMRMGTCCGAGTPVHFSLTAVCSTTARRCQHRQRQWLGVQWPGGDRERDHRHDHDIDGASREQPR